MNENLASYCGVTLDDAAEAMKKVMGLLPPPGETDITLIKANPSLNWFQKWKLNRFVKRVKKIQKLKKGLIFLADEAENKRKKEKKHVKKIEKNYCHYLRIHFTAFDAAYNCGLYKPKGFGKIRRNHKYVELKF